MSCKTVILPILAILVCMFSCGIAYNEVETPTSIHDFIVKDTYGQDFPLSKFRGKVVLIVNIASSSDLTGFQYSTLMELREKYHHRGLRIVALPSNEFGDMPENDGSDMMFHLASHYARFDLVMAKGDINGLTTIPLYQYLKAQQNDPLRRSIKGDFVKFLVDRRGHLIQRFAPITGREVLTKNIEKLLA